MSVCGRGESVLEYRHQARPTESEKAMIEFPPGVEACESRVIRNITPIVSVWSMAIIPDVR